MNYFQDCKMQVKWQGILSSPRDLPGGGALGSSLGVWEFLSQTMQILCLRKTGSSMLMT